MRALERDQTARRWLAWHVAYLPNAKKIPDPAEFIGGKARPEQRTQTADEIKAVMSQWRVAQAFAEPPRRGGHHGR